MSDSTDKNVNADDDFTDVIDTENVDTEIVDTEIVEKSKAKKPKQFKPKAKDLKAKADTADDKMVVVKKADAKKDDHKPSFVDKVKAAASPRTKKSALSLALKLGIAAVICGLIALFFFFHPGAPGKNDNQAFSNVGLTSELMAQAPDRVCAPFRFDYRSLDKDLAAAGAQLTGKAHDEFVKYVDTTTREVATQTKATSSCIADQVGIVSMTTTDAVVIAQLIVSVDTNGAANKSDTPRVVYNLEKHGDKWLVSSVVKDE